jgi:hypothetical protein
VQCNNAAKTEKSVKDGNVILGPIIQESVGAVADWLREMKGAIPHNKDVITLVADQLKHKQFASKEDMHVLQKMVGPPTTKLISGEDARSVLTRGNKKVYQNKLR